MCGGLIRGVTQVLRKRVGLSVWGGGVGAYRWKNGICIDVNCNPLQFSCGIGLLFWLSNNPSPSFHRQYVLYITVL